MWYENKESYMDIQTCQLLSKYNQAANQQMNLLISKLDSQQWSREFGGYFKSIQELCNHIYLADFNWLKRFSRLRHFNYITDSLFDVDLAFGTIQMSEIPVYLQKREVLDEKLVQFTNEIRQDDLDMPLSYTDPKGVHYTRNFGGLIIHVFNHQTHHRGMVSVYLDIMNINNDFSNVARLV